MLKYIVLAVAAGFFVPLQSLMNARTSDVLGGAFWATLVNFASGTLMAIALLAIIRAPVPSLEQVSRIPFYGWVSGFAGVLFVAQAAFTVPKLGAATMLAMIIAGQMVGSIVFDYFGILQPPHPVTWHKIAGAVLLLAGAWLVLRPEQ
jgi:transporter family-2 protein